MLHTLEIDAQDPTPRVYSRRGIRQFTESRVIPYQNGDTARVISAGVVIVPPLERNSWAPSCLQYGCEPICISKLDFLQAYNVRVITSDAHESQQGRDLAGASQPVDIQSQQAETPRAVAHCARPAPCGVALLR